MIGQDPVVSRLGDRLGLIIGPHGRFLRSSNLVAIQMMILGGGGFLFWLIAANRFPVVDLGKAAALVSITLFINFLTTLGLPVTVTRFASGRASDDRVVFGWCIWITTVASLIGSVTIAAIASDGFAGPIVTHGRIVAVLLMFIAVNGFSLLTLVDYRQIALGHNRVVLMRSIVLTCGRLIAVTFIPWTAGPLWIWGAMCLPIPVALVAGALANRADTPVMELRPLPVDYRRIIHFTIANWASLLLAQAPFFILPMIVLANVSATENANFYLVWTMAAMAFLIPQITGRMLLQDAHDDERSLRDQAGFSLKFTILLALIFLALTVPAVFLIEHLYGESYAEAAQVLPLLMLALLPFAVTTTVLNVVRARERNRVTITVSLTLAVCVLVPARFVVNTEGIVGVSMAWLFGHTLTAFLALFALEPLTREAAAVRRRPMNLVGAVLVVVAVVLPVLMLGPIGVGVALAVIATRWIGSNSLAPAVSAALLVTAALSTLFEGQLVAGLGYAQDRPIAAGSAGIAMGLLGSWALLGLSDQAAIDVTGEDVPEPVLSRSRVPLAERLAVPAAAALGATVGWMLSPALSSGASQLAAQLNGGRRMSDALGNLAPAAKVEPLVPLLVTIGPLTPQVLCAAAIAVILAVVVHSRAFFDRRERIIGIGLLTLMIVVLRDDLGGIVALALGLTAVSVALAADSWLEFAAACGLVAAGCLASVDLIPAALALVLLNGLAIRRLGSPRVGTTALSIVVIGILGIQMLRWLDSGSVGDALLRIEPFKAILFACSLTLPLTASFRRRTRDLDAQRPEFSTSATEWTR